MGNLEVYACPSEGLGRQGKLRRQVKRTVAHDDLMTRNTGNVHDSAQEGNQTSPVLVGPTRIHNAEGQVQSSHMAGKTSNGEGTYLNHKARLLPLPPAQMPLEGEDGRRGRGENPEILNIYAQYELEERETAPSTGRMESEIQVRGVKHRKLYSFGPE